MLVRSDEISLQALQPTLDVLATQAGLTLERLRLQDELTRQSRDAYFRTLVQNSAEAILIVDDDNRVEYASPSSESIFGRVPERGAALPDLVERAGRANAERFLGRTRAEPPAAAKPTLTGEWTVLAVDGTPARVEVSGQDVRHDPTIGGLIVTLRDITERRRLEHEAAWRFVHDSLTGLDNRLPFSDRLDAAMTRAATGDGVVGVLDVDVDDLKVINDGFGHGAGDLVLTTMGERMREFVGDDHDHAPMMAARLGGDEFAVLLADLADQSVADTAAAQLIHALGQPIDVGGNMVTCTVSIGVATTSEDSDTATELLRNADLALYAAKGAGKARWRHYEPWMRRTVMARLELRSALEHAIADDALSLEYQPIVDLEYGRTGWLRGAAALAAPHPWAALTGRVHRRRRGVRPHRADRRVGPRDRYAGRAELVGRAATSARTSGSTSPPASSTRRDSSPWFTGSWPTPGSLRSGSCWRSPKVCSCKTTRTS